MRNEPYDIPGVGPLPPNEDVWARVCAGQARRVYIAGGPVLEPRFLPHALGLEPVSKYAYRYDAQGAPTQQDDYLRIATQLAQDEGWLAYNWSAPLSEVFMRKADAIIWLDDARERRAKAMAQAQQADTDLLWVTVSAIQRGVRRWRRRRSADGDAHLLEIALESRPTARYDFLPRTALSEFPEKVLRVSHDGQLAQLNAVRPTR